MRPKPAPAAPGQESVWDYPRPAIAEPTARRLRIVHRGEVVAETGRAVHTLETSHPPNYYVPREDVAPGVLRPNSQRSLCEWKGQAVYFDVLASGDLFPVAAWRYPSPTHAFASLRDHVAFYAAPFDGCFLDNERVVPQPGGFYGGWILAGTSDADDGMGDAKNDCCASSTSISAVPQANARGAPAGAPLAGRRFAVQPVAGRVQGLQPATSLRPRQERQRERRCRRGGERLDEDDSQ